jgi:hypothetical protein
VYQAEVMTQSMAAMMPVVEPLPVHPSTRTATSWAVFATPNRVPPIVPATCVPWPWQSVESLSLLTKSRPCTARPPKSECVVRIPVSST